MKPQMQSGMVENKERTITEARMINKIVRIFSHGESGA